MNPDKLTGRFKPRDERERIAFAKHDSIADLTCWCRSDEFDSLDGAVRRIDCTRCRLVEEWITEYKDIYDDLMNYFRPTKPKDQHIEESKMDKGTIRDDWKPVDMTDTEKAQLETINQLKEKLVKVTDTHADQVDGLLAANKLLSEKLEWIEQREETWRNLCFSKVEVAASLKVDNIHLQEKMKAAASDVWDMKMKLLASDQLVDKLQSQLKNEQDLRNKANDQKD